MKKLFFVFVIILAFASCKKDDFTKFPQEWKLVSMNNLTTGSNMEWQESYLLKSDGTFTKSRTRNGIVTEASGTFTIKDLTDGKFLELTFKSGTSIIGSCTASAVTETIWIKSEKTMSSTWTNCDGPALDYERIK